MISSRRVFSRVIVVMMIVAGLLGARADSAYAQNRPKSCRGPGSLLLSEVGMGAVRLGETAASVKEKCDVYTDTVEVISEGMSQRVLYVSLGLGTLKAETLNDKVTRIVIKDTLLRAADGYGVGTTMQTLRLNPTVTALRGEGTVIMRVSTHCGLSFQLDDKFAKLVKGTPITAAALAVVPDSAKITRVLIVGCP